MPIGHGGAVQWSTIAEPEAKMVRVLFVVGGFDGWLVGMSWMAGWMVFLVFLQVGWLVTKLNFASCASVLLSVSPSF